MSLPRYPEYKDSGVEWLGEVPGHWEVKTLKHIVSTPITDGPHETPNFPDDGIPFVSAEAVASGKIDFSKIRGYISEADHLRYSQKYHPQIGDIYMVKSGATTGVTAIVETETEFNIWSPLAAIRCGKQATSRFVINFMRSKNFQEAVTLYWSFGTQQNIGMGVIENLAVPIPPLAEQQTIATFLDRETGKIDALIAEQQRLVELLAEKRQAVISHAVTKGLNPNVPMKDSGIEWLGEVPKHWNVGVKLKTLALKESAAFTNGPFGSDLLTSELQEEGVPVIYIRDLKVGGYRRTSTSYVTAEKALQLDKFRVDARDILIAKVGDPPGFCCTYPESEPPGIICQDVIRMKPNPELISPDYLCFLLNSTSGIEAIDSICVELTRKRFSLADLHSLRVPLPPRAEQDEISYHLKTVIGEFGDLTTEAQRAIELLKERRSTLISAAVTGKVDVRQHPERHTQGMTKQNYATQQFDSVG